MELPRDQVGPYVRALQAGLHALAPHEDHVPLAGAVAHLKALDPALSGGVLLPAEADPHSGLPAFPWMERALAEQALARKGDDLHTDADLEHAAALDVELARRLRHRRDLHRHLRSHELLPVSRLVATVRRADTVDEFTLTYDRLAPGGAWVRIRSDLTGVPGWSTGLLRVRHDDSVVADQGLKHLLARHTATPLLALFAQLEAATGARVKRLARSAVGPFWFPGFPLPQDAPSTMSNGLLLHLHTEVVALDVQHSAHRDPWRPADDHEQPPDGHGIYRERRFAASPSLVEATHAWAREFGFDVVVVPLSPSARPASP